MKNCLNTYLMYLFTYALCTLCAAHILCIGHSAAQSNSVIISTVLCGHTVVFYDTVSVCFAHGNHKRIRLERKYFILVTVMNSELETAYRHADSE